MSRFFPLLVLAVVLVCGLVVFQTLRERSRATQASSSAPSGAPVVRLYVFTDEASLRAEPNDSAKVLRTIPFKEEVIVRRTEGGWHLVRTPGRGGSEAWIKDSEVGTANQVLGRERSNAAQADAAWCSRPEGASVEKLVYRYDGNHAYLYSDWYVLPYEQKQAVLAWLGKCHGIYSVLDYQSGKRLGSYSDETGAVVK